MKKISVPQITKRLAGLLETIADHRQPAMGQVNDLRGDIKALQSLCGEAVPLESFKRFETFVTNPCTMNYEENGVDQYFEKCKPNDPNLHCWSLYGMKNGLVEHIADFPKHDRELCEFFRDILIALYATG